MLGVYYGLLNPTTSSPNWVVRVVGFVLAFVQGVVYTLHRVIVALLQFRFQTEDAPVDMGIVIASVSNAFLGSTGACGRPHFVTRCRRLGGHNVGFIITDNGRCCRLVSFFPRLGSRVSFITRGNTLICRRNGRLFRNRLAQRRSQVIVNRLLGSGRLGFITYNLRDTCIDRGTPRTFITLVTGRCRHLGPMGSCRRVSSMLFGFSLGLPSRRVPLIVSGLRMTLSNVVGPIADNFNFVSLVVPNLRGTGNVSQLLGH